MKTMTWRVLIALLLCLALPASRAAAEMGAGFFDGNDLFEWCTTRDALCTGYVAGISDELTDLEAIGAVTVTVCEPKEVKVKQMAEVVTRYLEKHPETRDRQASELVYRALVEAWPCKRGGR